MAAAELLVQGLGPQLAALQHTSLWSSPFSVSERATPTSVSRIRGSAEPEPGIPVAPATANILLLVSLSGFGALPGHPRNPGTPDLLESSSATMNVVVSNLCIHTNFKETGGSSDAWSPAPRHLAYCKPAGPSFGFGEHAPLARAAPWAASVKAAPEARQRQTPGGPSKGGPEAPAGRRRWPPHPQPRRTRTWT